MEKVLNFQYFDATKDYKNTKTKSFKIVSGKDALKKNGLLLTEMPFICVYRIKLTACVYLPY